MKITYLHHSAFLIEGQTSLLLFDWTNTPLPVLDPHKKLYVFASHSHADHFHPAIFALEPRQADIHYILSADIPAERAANRIFCVGDQRFSVDDILVETLTSTDEGVAFIVHFEETLLYFAGDLNWWDWGEEDSPQAAAAMEQAYRKEMSKLQGYEFTVAFLPVDPRLSQGYAKGMSCFMEYSNALYLVPMHFWDTPEIIDRLCEREECQSFCGRIQRLRKDMETFTIE